MVQNSVLVVGSAGREHALAWRLAQSPEVAQVYVAPGNAGTTWPAAPGRAAAESVPIAAAAIKELARFAREADVALAIVGPEVPLAAGIVDHFAEADLPIFGPTKAAAQLEASKAFAKNFMAEVGIPTAAFQTFQHLGAARDYLDRIEHLVVVKASGLAAGKGVIVCNNKAEAAAALHHIMENRAFGAAGDTVVVEERLQGPEISILAFSDGRAVAPMLPARDYKRARDDDRGPNTGGMGAYAPAADVSEELVAEVVTTILQPAVERMADRGTPYVGVLYAGLMLTEDGPKVLEFNCRFGDPETQVVLPLLETDLYELALACVQGRLQDVVVQWRPQACATVVMAAEGYPGSYEKGRPITGVDEVSSGDDTIVFHAGTKQQNGQLVTDGGRVLAVTALGPDLETALQRAYAGVAAIDFEGAHYRRDIGKKI
jgi:phosphoribosylamine--glycine ligase